MSHIFAICAYGTSPYLKYCVQSLLQQSVHAKIIICTSTPNKMIQGIAEYYHLPLYIREGVSNIQVDWNYAYTMADAEYVTIAHQDDIYHKDYLLYLEQYLQKYPDTLIAMTDYKIINQHHKVRTDGSLLVKKILKIPLMFPILSNKNIIKTGVQAFGNAICCPTVCYHKRILGDNIFQSRLDYALDWDTFYTIAKKRGRFTYIPKSLLYYRIHDEATTKKCLRTSQKMKEEYKMFQRFWPKWAVKYLMKIYAISYKNYQK